MKLNEEVTKMGGKTYIIDVQMGGLVKIYIREQFCVLVRQQGISTQ